jgi:hypothetical protein
MAIGKSLENMPTIEDRIELWQRRYKLNNLEVVGYQGGYPMIQFDKEDSMAVLYMSERDKKKIIKGAETFGGIELGVGYNFRNTAFIIINEDKIVICGHIFVIDRILEKIFQ